MRHVRIWRKPTPHSKAHPSVNRLNLEGESSDALMPADPRSRCEALEWLFAALNSVRGSYKSHRLLSLVWLAFLLVLFLLA